MQNKTVNDTVEVYNVVKKLGDLMIARDTASMTKILDTDFALTHITGYMQSKSDWLNEVAKESMKYYAAQEVNHAIHVNGNSADVTVWNLIDAKIWRNRNTWRLKQQMRLEKRHENWIILYAVASTF